MNPVVRPYAATDLDDVVEAWYAASLVAHPFLSEEFMTRERRLITEEWLPRAETFVAEVDGAVVGFLSLVENEVGGFFVHPDHQGRGAGRALMDHARGIRPFLELGVFEANEIGRRFYDAYGFAEVGREMNADAGFVEVRLRLG